MRRRALRAHAARRGRRLLPLHALPEAHGRQLGQARSTGDVRLLGRELVQAGGTRGGFEKCFCRECGSHLFSRNPDDASQMSIRMAAFDGDPGVRPSWRTFVAYAAPWEPVPDDGLERYEESRPR